MIPPEYEPIYTAGYKAGIIESERVDSMMPQEKSKNIPIAIILCFVVGYIAGALTFL